MRRTLGTWRRWRSAHGSASGSSGCRTMLLAQRSVSRIAARLLVHCAASRLAGFLDLPLPSYAARAQQVKPVAQGHASSALALDLSSGATAAQAPTSATLSAADAGPVVSIRVKKRGAAGDASNAVRVLPAKRRRAGGVTGGAAVQQTGDRSSDGRGAPQSLVGAGSDSDSDADEAGTTPMLRARGGVAPVLTSGSARAASKRAPQPLKPSQPSQAAAASPSSSPPRPLVQYDSSDDSSESAET